VSTLRRKLRRDVWRLRGQVISIALVVAAGVMAVITMQSTFVSLEASRDAYYRDYRFADVFASLDRAPESLARQIELLPGVAAVHTRVVWQVLLRVPGLERTAIGQIVSIPDEPRPTLNDLHIRSGRYVAPRSEDEILISESFAELNGLGVGDTIGAVINGRNRTLTIVGTALSPEFVYETEPTAGFLTDQRLFGVLWMGREAIAAASDMTGAFNDVVLGLAPGASRSEVIRELDVLLTPYGGLGAYGSEDQLSNRLLHDEIEQNRVTAIFIPAVFLSIAAFLLHIVLLRVVATEREQIAVLKAFGYFDRDVALHYLGFAFAAVAVGVLIGVSVGYLLGAGYTAIYAEFFRFPELQYRVGWSTAFIAILISALAATAGALAAVRAALRVQPAEGMRAEPPATFRPLFLERWGLHTMLSAAQRMIMRNLERRPLRAVLSAVGVGFSLAVLLLGMTMLDSIRLMMDMQFRVLQAEDLVVGFNRPVDARALREVARVPGVVLAEPFRAVPVRIRNGHRERRIALTGLNPQGELRRMVGADGEAHSLPENGVILTDRLATLLAARPGDTLRVELLDRGGAARSVVLIAVIDELIGTNGYMALPALHRLTREGSTISGAYLKLERDSEPTVHAALAEMPAVGATVSKLAMVRSFEDQMAQSFSITMGILLVLAGVLAVGVIYNGARIALSERGRELASLRVLGFTRAEVAAMLLGEQAVITAIGIPIGVLIGYALAQLLVRAFTTELYRIPLALEFSTIVTAAVAIAAIAAGAGLLVRRRLDRADLIAVLKTRE
jgi:putative ABC transport system permease protein